MNRWLGITAIVVNITSLMISIWTLQQADARADAALQRREQQLVDLYVPQVNRICEDFGIDPPVKPKSIEELAAPLVRIVSGLNEQ